MNFYQGFLRQIAERFHDTAKLRLQDFLRRESKVEHAPDLTAITIQLYLPKLLVAAG